MRASLPAGHLIRRQAAAAGVMLEMIKFQHTVFALPFALAATLMAADGLPPWPTILWIVAAATCARTAAMSFNRWADAEIDARNPRTATRAIPAGLLTRRFALVTAIASALMFSICAGMLNKLALALSPLALLVLFGYSYTKRCTSLSHFVLGLALGIAPVGAWVAVRGELGFPAILMGAGVMMWTAGFDMLYACQDREFDRANRLYSVPAKLGLRTTLVLSAFAYVVAVGLLTAAGIVAEMGSWYFGGAGGVAVLLIAEHMVVTPHDPTRIELAFFKINSWVGMLVLAFTAIDVLVMR